MRQGTSPTTTLIISTYNWPEALELCLLSVKAQQVLPNEVIIADDGSKEGTRSLIHRYQQDFPVPLFHIWHEDEGFRLAMIRNKAIATSKYEYIIQIDGDLILHPSFISDHIRFAKPDTFVRASRIYMNEQLSSKLLQTKRIDVSLFTEGLSNKMSAMHLPVIWSYFEHNYKAHQPYEIHGCNMAFWRENAIAVNGYNERFKGWGPEDKEFVVRLLNKGYSKRFLKMGAIVYHIWHKENSKENLPGNECEFKTSIEQNRDFCQMGIDQYLNDSR